MKPKQDPGPRQEAHQTVRLQIDTKNAAPSIRAVYPHRLQRPTAERLRRGGGLVALSAAINGLTICF